MEEQGASVREAPFVHSHETTVSSDSEAGHVFAGTSQGRPQTPAPLPESCSWDARGGGDVMDPDDASSFSPPTYWAGLGPGVQGGWIPPAQRPDPDLSLQHVLCGCPNADPPGSKQPGFGLCPDSKASGPTWSRWFPLLSSVPAWRCQESAAWCRHLCWVSCPPALAGREAPLTSP